ncbi:MAG: hypothetical protein ACRECO_22505 [Xanthobacteraceae bacterium]
MSGGEFFGALLYIVGVVVPSMIVVRRIGYSRWWGLIALVPFVNMVMLWVLASASWPIEERLNAAEWAAERALSTP